MKTYRPLFQRQPDHRTLYRLIWIDDFKEGFRVTVLDRVWSDASDHVPLSETKPIEKLFSDAQEAIAEADKHYEDSLKAGLRPSDESF